MGSLPLVSHFSTSPVEGEEFPHSIKAALATSEQSVTDTATINLGDFRTLFTWSFHLAYIGVTDSGRVKVFLINVHIFSINVNYSLSPIKIARKVGTDNNYVWHCVEKLIQLKQYVKCKQCIICRLATLVTFIQKRRKANTIGAILTWNGVMMKQKGPL